MLYGDGMDEQQETISEAVARKIRGLMGEHRCSQKALGIYLDLSQGSISNRLNGSVPWSIDEMDRVAAKFDVPITRLLPDPDPESPSRWYSDLSIDAEPALA